MSEPRWGQAGIWCLLASLRGTSNAPIAGGRPSSADPRRVPSHRAGARGITMGRALSPPGPPHVGLLGTPSWGTAGRKRRSCCARLRVPLPTSLWFRCICEPHPRNTKALQGFMFYFCKVDKAEKNSAPVVSHGDFLEGSELFWALCHGRNNSGKTYFHFF